MEKKRNLVFSLSYATNCAKLRVYCAKPRETAGINEGQQVKQIFKDKIDPLRHKLMQDLINGAKFTGILPDIYKYQMPTFYKATSIFIKPKT